MSDFIESINNGFKSRLKNPILGGFIFSWLVINWRPIVYIILSDDPVIDRFKFINVHYLNIGNLFWWPFVTSIGIFIALPYLMAMLDFFTGRGRILRKKQKSVEVENDLRLEISRVRVMQELEDVKAKYLDRESLNDEIKELKSALQKSDIQDKENQKFKKEYMDIFRSILSIGESISILSSDFLTDEEYRFDGLPEETREQMHLKLSELSEYLTSKNPTPQLRADAEEFLKKNEILIDFAEEQELISLIDTNKKSKSRYTLSNLSMTVIGMKTLILYQNELARKFVRIHVNRDKELPF